jgi:chromosome segregation ATPase
MILNLTYDDLAERLGTTRNAARVLAQRRKWSRYTSQDDGKARVRVPEDELERIGAQRNGHGAVHEPLYDVPQVDGEIQALKAHIQTLCGMLEQKDAAHAAELGRIEADQARLIGEHSQLQDRLQKALAEADHAKSDQVRMARDVANMFDELRALADRHAELHADRARLEAGLERLQDERNRAILDADQAREDIKRQHEHANTMLGQINDLNDSLERLRRERQAEVGRLRAELKQERIRWWHRWLRQ